MTEENSCFLASVSQEVRLLLRRERAIPQRTAAVPAFQGGRGGSSLFLRGRHGRDRSETANGIFCQPGVDQAHRGQQSMAGFHNRERDGVRRLGWFVLEKRLEATLTVLRVFAVFVPPFFLV